MVENDERMEIVLAKQKYFLNEERFNLEMDRHKGQTHSKIRRKGHLARLDMQTDIAYIIGVERMTLNNYIKNRESIPENNLKALAKLFGCDWEYLCGQQDYRTSPEGLMDALNELSERAKRAKENDEPFLSCEVLDDDFLITCNKYSVKKLIVEIARHDGYRFIIEGLQELASDIKAANEENNKPMSF